MTHDALGVRPILWTLHEAACYLADEVPATDMQAARRQVLGENAMSKAGQLFRLLKDARIAGTSKIIQLPGGWLGHDRIRPADAIALAQSWGLVLTPRCLALAADTGANDITPVSCDTNEQSISESERGVPKWAIVSAFRVRTKESDNDDYWRLKLSDPPAWLRSARTFSGGRRVTSLWNPLLVALALLKRSEMTPKALDGVMRNQFWRYWDEWSEETKGASR